MKTHKLHCKSSPHDRLLAQLPQKHLSSLRWESKFPYQELPVQTGFRVCPRSSRSSGASAVFQQGFSSLNPEPWRAPRWRSHPSSFLRLLFRPSSSKKQWDFFPFYLFIFFMKTMYLGQSLINAEVVYFTPNNANPPFPCRRVE